MLEMLCALPCPCGEEEITKKYIMQKHPECKTDDFGNLIRTIGKGDKKILVYASLDEDSLVAMEIKGSKVYFSHLGKRKIYPGQTVSFGGYTGVLQGEGEDKYIELIDSEDGIEVGRCGVLEGEFEGDINNEKSTLLGKNIAQRTAISAMLSIENSSCEVDFVFGVQSNHRNKGLSATVNTLDADEVLIFEETNEESFTLKVLGKGYCASQSLLSKAEEILNELNIPFVKTADSKEQTLGETAPWGKSLVVGIPVKFSDLIRQAIKSKTVKDVNKFIEKFVEA